MKLGHLFWMLVVVCLDSAFGVIDVSRLLWEMPVNKLLCQGHHEGTLWSSAELCFSFEKATKMLT